MKKTIVLLLVLLCGCLSAELKNEMMNIAVYNHSVPAGYEIVGSESCSINSYGYAIGYHDLVRQL